MDPLGLIGPIDRSLPPMPGAANAPGAPGTPGTPDPGFKKALSAQIDKVNQLQQDATAAIEDLATGQRDDVESVLIATQKADTAFKLLLQVRNKVIDAYDEIKQMRV